MQTNSEDFIKGDGEPDYSGVAEDDKTPEWW
jgi:hypothetical protein